jgi:hypothetical protein
LHAQGFAGVGDPAVVGVEAEIGADRPGGVADVDARKGPGAQDAGALAPHVIEGGVHPLAGTVGVEVVQVGADLRVLLYKTLIPHFDHRIRRRGHDEIYRVIREGCHIGRRGKDDGVACFHCRKCISREAERAATARRSP